MATTMEQRAKFRELRLTGTSREDAMKQAYGDIVNPPAPTPTGGATIPITPTVQETPTAQPTQAPTPVQPIQSIQPQTQVNPQNEQAINKQYGGFIQDNGINSVQPLQKGPTQLPAGTNEPVKAKETPQVDFNVSQGREGEIQKNIADITATNPNLLKDRNAYNQAFGYETADQGKKAILDSAFQSGQPQIPTSDQMFSSIIMKAPVADDQKTTTQYKIAQNRYLKANSYASMTPSQVSSDITSGKLIEGSQTYEDIKALNPKLIQDTNNLRIVNGSKVSLYSTDAQGNRVNNVEQSFTEDYLGNFGTFLKSLFTVQTPEQIRSAIYTDDVKQAQDKATSIELELNQIEADQAKIEEITRKELEGTGASAERIRLEIGIRQEKLQNQYNSKLKEYNTYANKANNLITQNTTVYQEQMKQQSAQQQALAGAAGQVFSSQLAIKQKQAEFDQQIAQQAQLATDPISGTNAIIDTFEKMGIMADRSRQEIIADVQTKVASGIPLGQALSELQQAFKSKPQYQKALELQMGQLSDVQKMQLGYQQDINKMAIGNQYDLTKMGINNQQDISKLMLNYNLGNKKDIQSSKIDLMGKGFTPDQADAIVRTATGNWKGATGETLLFAPDSTIIPSRLSETTNPNGGKECGEYVNDIVGSGTVGSTWASKSSKIDSSITVPTVGNTAVWIPDPNNPTFAQYGHAGIITEVNGNNVTIKSSNLNGQGEISTITVPISEITKTGGFIGTAIKGPGKTTGLGKDDVKNINGLYDDLKGIDTFKNWKAISSQVTWFNDLKNKELNGSDIQGLITNYAKVLDPTSVVRESEFAMAQKGANQGAIDRAKTSIATYLNGGSAVLSKEAQEALKSAMARRFDAVKEAYVNEVDAQVARGKQMGMPVTWENLTGESRDSYTKGTQSTQGNLVISKEAALDLYNKWKANQQ